jgi:predicted metal-dependent hydrolase
MKFGRQLDRAWLHDNIQLLVDKWEPILGVRVQAWDIKPMKTYWASVNEHEGKITFNLKLADKPHTFLEVIVVHELVHFLTDGHDRRFYELMDRHVPNWRRLHARYAEPLMRHN